MEGGSSCGGRCRKSRGGHSPTTRSWPRANYPRDQLGCHLPGILARFQSTRLLLSWVGEDRGESKTVVKFALKKTSISVPLVDTIWPLCGRKWTSEFSSSWVAFQRWIIKNLCDSFILTCVSSNVSHVFISNLKTICLRFGSWNLTPVIYLKKKKKIEEESLPGSTVLKVKLLLKCIFHPPPLAYTEHVGLPVTFTNLQIIVVWSVCILWWSIIFYQK